MSLIVVIVFGITSFVLGQYAYDYAFGKKSCVVVIHNSRRCTVVRMLFGIKLWTRDYVHTRDFQTDWYRLATGEQAPLWLWARINEAVRLDEIKEMYK